jgi:hypothetical protein
VLNDIATHPELKAYLAERLPGFLVRPEDRKLFSEFMPASAPGSGLVVDEAGAGANGTGAHAAPDGRVTGPPAL